MLNRLTTAYGKAVTLLMLIVIFSSQANAQTTIGRQKVDQFPCTWWGMTTYGLTWLPTDYSTNTNQKYPLIIFLHGKGETGDGIGGLNNLVTTALPQYIANGWDPVAVNPADGQTYKFIVVSPQAPVASQWSYTWDNVQYILQDVINRYRVDVSRIYVTGLSAGGNGTWTCVTNGPAAAKKFAAIVPVSSASVALDSIPKVGSQYGVKLWQICGDQDAFYSWVTQSTSSYNSSNPNPMAVVTPIAGQGHWASAWNTAYDPNWRSNIHNKNIYEWMLQYKRTDVNNSNPPPVNQAPTANAGADQSITLPTNSVTLSGSASDADGSISSYAWTKVSGPASGTISSPSSASTQVTGLVEGSYTFRLTATDNAGATGSDDVVVTVINGSNQQPPSSSIKIEAESYTSMSGIGTENTSDVGGGLNVGWQDNNDWMNYSVNLSAAGTYTLNFRVASYFTGAQFQLKKADGTVLTTVTVPNTGSFQTWTTISTQVTLPAGQQTLRIFTSAANGGWNINWWEITGASSSTPPPSTSTKIEAESYSAMLGIGTENTSDVGGGLNVGWQDNNDWMDYVVNASGGSYTVDFRVASYFTGATFQLRKSDGTVLATMTVPNTGSFQTWTTISTTVTLPAGQQTLKLFTTAANGGWNINWWQIASASSARGTTTAATTVEQVFVKTTSAEALQVFPNPIQDRFMLKVNNDQAGKMKVEIMDAKGSVVKQFSVNKAAAGISQSYLSIGDLQTGQYILKVSMNNYSETKQLIKN